MRQVLLQHGGVTSATFDSVTYTLSGGKGGQIGTSSTDTSNVIQGIGGLGGIVSSNVSDTTNIEYKNGLKGDDGNTYTTTTGFVVSNGGNGGTSGLDTKGGCGGLFIDSSICTNTNVNGTSVNFVSPNQIFDTAQYGSAGAVQVQAAEGEDGVKILLTTLTQAEAHKDKGDTCILIGLSIKVDG